jgi:hypothetical protein
MHTTYILKIIYTNVSQPMCHEPHFSHEGTYILIWSWNNMMYLFITNSHYFHKCVRRSIFVNVITCNDTVTVLAWLSFSNKWQIPLNTRVISLSSKNCHISQKMTIFSNVIAWCEKFSQLEKYLPKQGKIQIHKFMNTTSPYESRST